MPGTCSSNGLYNTSTLHQGGAATFLSSITSDCLENQVQIHNVNNFWYLNADNNGDKLQIKSGTSLTN